MVGHVSEGGLTFHITYGVDTWNAGFQPLADLDSAFLVGLDPRCLQIEPLGVGHPACGHQQM